MTINLFEELIQKLGETDYTLYQNKKEHEIILAIGSPFQIVGDLSTYNLDTNIVIVWNTKYKNSFLHHTLIWLNVEQLKEILDILNILNNSEVKE